MYKILIIEDEYHIRHIIKEYFEIHNITTIEASNGYEGLNLINSTYDLILLDIMMKGIDGYEVCKLIRQKSNIPIIFISALSDSENQLLAYQLGADDYITKPFQLSILYAKVNAMIKRNKGYKEELLDFGAIKLDKLNKTLIINNHITTLANKEFELLNYLCSNPNRVLSREQILDQIWGIDYFGDGRAVDTYIKKIRKKLGKYSHYIQTIIKTGYMFKVVETNEKDI